MIVTSSSNLFISSVVQSQVSLFHFIILIMDKQKSHIEEMEEAFAAIQIEDEEYGGLSYENDNEDLSEIDM